MRKLDLRTMVVMLVVFALSYAACLAMPAVQAEEGDRLVVSEIVADRIIANQTLQSAGTIGFVNGATLSGSGGFIISDDGIQAPFFHASSIGGFVQAYDYLTGARLILGGYSIVDVSRNLQNVIIDQNVTGGKGLDAGMLGGHPGSDFILRSEINNDFCRTFCPIVLKTE